MIRVHVVGRHHADKRVIIIIHLCFSQCGYKQDENSVSDDNLLSQTLQHTAYNNIVVIITHNIVIFYCWWG